MAAPGRSSQRQAAFVAALVRWDLRPEPTTLEKIEAARQGPDRL